MGEAIEAGKVVRLRSGGPRMTVIGVEHRDRYQPDGDGGMAIAPDPSGPTAACTWFERPIVDAKPGEVRGYMARRADFYVSTLEVVDLAARRATAKTVRQFAVPLSLGEAREEAGITAGDSGAPSFADLHRRAQYHYHASYGIKSEARFQSQGVSTSTQERPPSKIGVVTPFNTASGWKADYLVIDETIKTRVEPDAAPVPDPFDSARYRDDPPADPPAERSSRGYEFLGQL